MPHVMQINSVDQAARGTGCNKDQNNAQGKEFAVSRYFAISNDERNHADSGNNAQDKGSVLKDSESGAAILNIVELKNAPDQFNVSSPLKRPNSSLFCDLIDQDQCKKCGSCRDAFSLGFHVFSSDQKLYFC